MFVFCVGDALIAVLCSIGFPLFIVFVVFCVSACCVHDDDYVGNVDDGD